MLKLLRQKHIAKIIFWGLVILIMPAFVMWGTGSLTAPKEKGSKFVGYIGKKKVSFNDLYESQIAIRSQIVLNYSGQQQILEAFFKNKPLMAKLAWDRLVMLDEARARKIKVPDNMLVAYIQNHPLFMRNGRFDDKIYDYILRYNLGLAPRSFEEITRENLSIQKLKDEVTKDMKTDDEKAGALDKWLGTLSGKTKLIIDFNEIEKYYR